MLGSVLAVWKAAPTPPAVAPTAAISIALRTKPRMRDTIVPDAMRADALRIDRRDVFELMGSPSSWLSLGQRGRLVCPRPGRDFPYRCGYQLRR